jgi:hypothetical protein
VIWRLIDKTSEVLPARHMWLVRVVCEHLNVPTRFGYRSGSSLIYQQTSFAEGNLDSIDICILLLASSDYVLPW